MRGGYSTQSLAFGQSVFCLCHKKIKYWLDFSVSESADGFGIDAVFFDLDSGVESFGGVTREDGDAGLGDDLAAVDDFIDPVDGASGFLGSGEEGLFPSFEAREGGE